MVRGEIVRTLYLTIVTTVVNRFVCACVAMPFFARSARSLSRLCILQSAVLGRLHLSFRYLIVSYKKKTSVDIIFRVYSRRTLHNSCSLSLPQSYPCVC